MTQLPTILRFGANRVVLRRPLAPRLLPGAGWGGATDQPSAVGDSGGLGYSRKPIARWDSPMFTLDVTDTLHVGIPAFHINAGGTIGIDRVEIAAAGGDWVTARRGVNPDTGVLEYYVQVRASDFTDGTHELRARVYPVCGVPRVLAGSGSAGERSMYVTTNAGLTLPRNVVWVATDGNDTTGNGSEGTPYRTIMRAARRLQDLNGNGNADGGTIYLKAGGYPLGPYQFSWLTTTVNRWLTITHAPGLTRADVTITGSSNSDGLRTKLVRLYDVTVNPTISTVSGTHYLWIDSCAVVGNGRTVEGDGYSNDWTDRYFTDSTVTAVMNGFSGSLIRNCTVDGIGQIAFGTGTCVLNSTARNIDMTGTEFHPDVIQYHGNPGNCLAQGITATQNIGAQGIFSGDNITLNSAAIVDCDVTIQSFTRCLSFGGPTSNVLVKDSNFVGSALFDQSYSGSDIVIEGCTFNPALTPASGMTVR